MRARDPETQAVLPIRGKILNVERARIDRMLKNNEIQAIIGALGTGIGDPSGPNGSSNGSSGTHDGCDITKARYHKVIVLADADVDGSHIRTLLLTFFYRQMRPLVEAGYVYVAQPPLYSTKVSNSKTVYLLDDAARDAFLAERPKHSREFQRLKGLGEMDWDELRSTTMDARTRSLLQVSVEEAAIADQVISVLMGKRCRVAQELHRHQRQRSTKPRLLTRQERPMSDEADGTGGGPADFTSGQGVGVTIVEIQEEMESSFLDYAMSVIISRALPDARDGLKPVHRRILWSMYDQGFRPDRGHVKCARVVGDVMARFHPHGDAAIYDALARMAQPFSLQHPLIDFHGNYGSPEDPPAAARYTECRLDPLAMSMLADIGENTVDFIDNYSGDFTEPAVLPARLPNLLVNGSQGIAVGMATSIPPHNLAEVIDAVVHLLEVPDAGTEDLMVYMRGPDFPTGGQILGRSGFESAYRTGRGSVKMRADVVVAETGGRRALVVTALPYQVSAGAVARKIADLVNARELEGIADVNDESSGDETRFVIKLKRDANPEVVLNNLWKHTPLQSSFAMNMVALVDGVPRTLTLRDALSAYVAHQVEVVTRRSEFRLAAARARLHIVEGLLRALGAIDEIIALIRASENTGTAPRRPDGRAV